MKKYLAVLVLCTLLASVVAQVPKQLESFKIYNQKGKELRFDKWIKEMSGNDVVLFGELHNNAINHWLQYEVVKNLYLKTEQQLTVGAEMFERDAQLVVNEYLNGLIKLSHLKKEGKAWDNFDTDYLPVLDFCKDSGINFIASNVPRRYASLVAKKGLEGLEMLSAEGLKNVYSKSFEVDMNIPGYTEMLDMMGAHGHGQSGTSTKNFVAAQAIKDITMAESIVTNLEEDKLFLHLNGDFHSKEFGGIYWYLATLNEKLEVAVVSVVLADGELNFEESYGKLGDYILVINQNVTNTY